MKAGKDLCTKVKHKLALVTFSYLLQLQLRSEGQESALHGYTTQQPTAASAPRSPSRLHEIQEEKKRVELPLSLCYLYTKGND